MNYLQKHILIFRNPTFFAIMLFSSISVHAQFYNKEYVADVVVKKDSEFFTFSATAENITPTDINLKYDFSVYRTDSNKNISRSNQSNLFFLKGNEKKVLSAVTINHNEEGEVTLLLILYDMDGKPVGQKRIALNSDNGYQELINSEKGSPEKEATNLDQAKPQDGFKMDGLIVENTITKAGRDFYKYFYSEYFNRGIQTDINIIIEEVPGKMRSTRISVKMDNQVLWQFFSQPNKTFLQTMALTALDRCIAYLQQVEKLNTNTLIRY